MTALLRLLRGEPAATAGLVTIACTLAITLTHNDATTGAVVSAIEAAATLLTRQLVTPAHAPV
jgi:translation initiation factor 2 gamma subunit (eIF-2gamma)